MIFLYKYRDKDGSIKTGRTTGDNKAKAEAKLHRLDITFLSLWGEDEKEPAMTPAPVPEWMKDAVTPPEKKPEDTGVTVLLSEEEEAKLLETQKKSEKLFESLTPKMGPPPELIKEVEAVERERAMKGPDLVRGDQVVRACPRRRQTFMIDEAAKVEARINDLLVRKLGKVVLVTMTTDTRGKVQVAAVVEHEE